MSKTVPKRSTDITKRVIWDCESSLYDSFELKSFEKQLNSAISSRTLSMPHLSDSRLRQPPPLPKKPTSKISRSIQRLVRAVFRPKHNTGSKFHHVDAYEDGFGSQRYESSPNFWLSTISEIGEYDHGLALSPDLKSDLRRKAVSERFNTSRVANSIGISCA